MGFPPCDVFIRIYAQKLTGAIIPALMHRIHQNSAVKRAWARVVLGWRAEANGCDHTSTNAPDPIRTPQLSVLGRE
ncbi:hypothetical protein RJ640_010565 [Escallonia rubra]|uniref:Uncharacterized protein n=1 Tax=Escallonia rubra TaxID=112253 RepID=A0AA88UJH2_9ASTE|nr:hypothetical protein RJ640_010565 [Escallonia rubra]